MATWARKATLRRSGQIARTVRIDFHLTREKFAIVAIYHQNIYGDACSSRRQLVERVESFLRDNGYPTYNHIEGLVEDQDTALAEAALVVDRLMPELKGNEK